MELTKSDKALLASWGFREKDFPQIEEAMKKSKTKYKLGATPISREKAIALLGREVYLSGISRSAFHFSAAREVPSKDVVIKVVYFDSSSLFK